MSEKENKMVRFPRPVRATVALRCRKRQMMSLPVKITTTLLING